ncbi:MAG: FKBP-type peptidyl-prolyl cis-trans isomerase [Fimbriimonadaceae bacterium]
MQILGLALLSVLCHAGGAPPRQQKPSEPPKLIVEDLTVGKGDPVEMGDEVKVDYTGKLVDGKVFDSSLNPGREPFDLILGVSPVIKGWTQGLVGMRVNGVRKLTIPSSLGYGAQGAPPTIPANATLVFTITLHKIDHPANRLKVTITHPGGGAALTWGDVAMIKLTGKTSDGSVFVSTGDSMPLGVPFAIGATHAPPGFTLGFVGMKAGEKRTVIVPPELGFGATGQPQLKVKPNATLTLEVELVSIGGPNGPSRSKDKRQ